MSRQLREVPFLGPVKREVFLGQLLTQGQPVVLRQQVAGWPMVAEARVSESAILGYLKDRSQPGLVKTLEAPHSSGGLLSYRRQLNGFSFERRETTFCSFADRLLKYAGRAIAPVLSIQSAYVDEYFTSVHNENPLDLLDSPVRPRIWIGNKTVTPTHYDDSDNLACVVAGRRRFMLFPPEQVANLYIGPLDYTPAGAPVSLVSLRDPDFTRYPRLKEAFQHACVAELEPGDAIYIPRLWWHHVEALSEVNVLVNYWYGGAISGERGPFPMDAMLLALLTLKSQPRQVQLAWKAMFDHFVFAANGDPAEHIPEGRKGILGELDRRQISQLKSWLAGRIE